MNRPTIALMSTLAFAALVSDASAAQYRGWGDTGWVYASKRDCCNAAVELANEDGALRCLEAGGQPSALRGSRKRGSCSWTWMQDPNGEVVYRCQSEAQSSCR
jgi:hypothetical protein